MSFTQLEENTLGVIVGHAKRAASTTARWLNRAGIAHRASIGTAFLGLGAAIIVGLRSVYGLSWFAALWPSHPDPLLALGAWAVLIASLLAVLISVRIRPDRLPDGMFALFVAGIVASVSLDAASVWSLHDFGRTATAALAAGTALLAVVTLRGPWEVLGTAGALGLGFAGIAFFSVQPGTVPDPGWITAQITALSLAVAPAVIGVVVVESFRRMVQVELDRVLVQSTVSAPRFAVGMLASEELARLDLAAEELLDSIANRRTPLPLPPRTASVAASLATELRLHLIEGRRETWLYHAISESEMLGRAVTLVDKSSLAGLLDPGQRDGLLAATWLLVSDTRKGHANRTVTLELGPVDPGAETPDHRIVVPIRINTSGVSRSRVDPAIWDALGRIGEYADSTEGSSLRVDITCLVENPAET